MTEIREASPCPHPQTLSFARDRCAFLPRNLTAHQIVGELLAAVKRFDEAVVVDLGRQLIESDGQALLIRRRRQRRRNNRQSPRVHGGVDRGDHGALVAVQRGERQRIRAEIDQADVIDAEFAER